MNTVKERILNTASELFFNQGYGQTGINQIIEESKVAKGSLYYNFKSKTDLLISYLKISDESIMQYFENELKTEDDPLKKILLLVDLRFSLLEKGGYRGCRFARIVSEISAEEEDIVLPVVRGFKKKYFELIQQLVIQLDSSKKTSDIEVVNTIYLLMEGASTQASIDKNNSAFIQTRKIIAEML